MKYRIECSDPDYSNPKIVNGPTSLDIGESIFDAMLYTDLLPVGTSLNGFTMQARSRGNPRNLVNVKLEKLRDGLLARNLVKRGQVGDLSSTIYDDFIRYILRTRIYEVVVIIKEIEYPCRLSIPKTETIGRSYGSKYTNNNWWA